MKVDGSLRSLLQGVSQQPMRDRLPGQCQEMINMSADPVTGLARRPGSDMVGRLGAVTTAPDVQWRNIETRDGLKYLFSFRKTDGTIRCWDLNGESVGVTVTNAARTYLTGFSRLSFTSIREETYVANASKVVTMRPDVFPYWNRGAANGGVTVAAVQILGSAYGRRMTINVNGGVIAYVQLPNGSEAEHADWISTTLIAQYLSQGLRQPLNYSPGNGFHAFGSGALSGAQWTVALFESTILIVNNNGVNFDVTAADGYGNVNMKAMVGQTSNIADLPKYAASGYVVRIASKSDPDLDSYYRFVLESDPSNTGGQGFGQSGYWQEAVAPNTPYMLNAETMPIVMTYNPTAKTFSVDVRGWANRTSGTTLSNANPSFVGSTINDLGQFQGRLVAVASNYVIMSRTNFPNDWWIKSVENQADTDPIDISSDADNTGAMEYIVPHNKDLVIFSSNGQFVIYGRNSLTPSNAALMRSTSFQADLTTKPSPSGRNIFFATNYGRYTNIREFYTEGGTEINDTRPITQHVKEFIAGRPKLIVSSSNYEVLLVSGETFPNRVYLYQYIWSDSEKVQSAWSYWEMDAAVDFMFMEEQNVYIVMRNTAANSYYLYRLSLDVFDPEGIGYPARLDARFDIINCFTQFVVPEQVYINEGMVLIQGVGCPNPGMEAEVQTIANVPGTGTVVTLRNNMNGGNLLGGIKFKSRYVPTPPLIKDEDGVVVSTGNLRIKHFLVTVDETGYFRYAAESKYYPPTWLEFEGRILNSAENIIGQEALYSGTIALPYRDKVENGVIAFETESHLPFTLLDVEWVGQYLKRGRRVNIGGG